MSKGVEGIPLIGCPIDNLMRCADALGFLCLPLSVRPAAEMDDKALSGFAEILRMLETEMRSAIERLEQTMEKDGSPCCDAAQAEIITGEA